MSTLVVVSAVMVAALVVVMGIALSDSDQPATIRLGTRRARRRSRQRSAAPSKPRRRETTSRPAADAQPVVTSRLPEPAVEVAPSPALVDAPASPAVRAMAPMMTEPDAPTLTAAPRVVEDATVAEELPPPPPPPPPAPPARSATRAATDPVPAPTTGRSSGRVRSGLALVVMIAFLGTLLAVAVGVTVALAGQALRHAVG